MSGPEVKFKDLHPWGNLPTKTRVAGQNKPRDKYPESAWVACRFCGMRNNLHAHAECRQCGSDNYA